MECPRCNSTIPDDMKFCGQCGIEVESGEKATIDVWINYFELASSAISDRQSSTTIHSIAGVALFIGSILTMVLSYPYLSFQSRILVILSIIGFILGASSLVFFWEYRFELNILGTIYERALQNLLHGELVTSKEIDEFVGDHWGRFKHRMRIHRKLTESLERKLQRAPLEQTEQ